MQNYFGFKITPMGNKMGGRRGNWVGWVVGNDMCLVCGCAIKLSPTTSMVMGCTTSKQPSHVHGPRGTPNTKEFMTTKENYYKNASY
jgi:hypothetical protein